MKRLALVTGATGAVGPRIVGALAADGYHVRILARAQPASSIFDCPVEVVIGDVTDADAVARAVHGVDVVMHLAARLHINNPSAALADEYHRVNVQGTRNVVDAALVAAVRRVIYFSTISVYGDSANGILFTEQSATRAENLYARSKRDAEAIVLAARRPCDEAPLGVVLRLAAVYGPRMRGNYRSLVEWMQRGLFVPIGCGSNRRTLVHEDDVAAAALLAAQHDAAGGRIFNVTDGSVHTLREILQAIADPLGRKAPRYHIPLRVARPAARTADFILMRARRRPMARHAIDKLVEDVAVSGERICSELSFQPRVDLATGWRRTIQAIAAQEKP